VKRQVQEKKEQEEQGRRKKVRETLMVRRARGLQEGSLAGGLLRRELGVSVVGDESDEMGVRAWAMGLEPKGEVKLAPVLYSMSSATVTSMWVGRDDRTGLGVACGGELLLG